MHGPEVSVVVPAHNAAATLGRALDSVAMQEGVDWELIVVDDGSCDATREVASCFSREHGRAHIISQENQGRSAARNAGILAARGTWLCFLDADDYYLPGAFRAMLDEGEGYEGCDLVWSGYETPDGVVGELGRNGLVGADAAVQAFLNPCAYEEHGGMFGIAQGVVCRTVWAKLFRRSLVVQHGIAFPEGLFRGEDGLFSLRCLVRAGGVRFVGEATYFWDTALSGTCRRFEPKHAQALVDYAMTCGQCLSPELQEGLMPEETVRCLVAREAASTLSDAATKCKGLGSAARMLAPAFDASEVKSSLGYFRSISKARMLTWGVESRLLQGGHIGAALMFERIGAALK